MGSTQVCGNCGQVNNAQMTHCVVCGHILPSGIRQIATQNLDARRTMQPQVRWGTAYFGDQTRLLIHVQHVDVTLEQQCASECVLGRAAGEFMPDIDLLPYGALELGVSRRHAKLLRRSATIMVQDLDSVNGTFLNGERLIPQQPRVLRNDDELCLGRLVLHVSFRRLAQTAPSGSSRAQSAAHTSEEAVEEPPESPATMIMPGSDTPSETPPAAPESPESEAPAASKSTAGPDHKPDEASAPARDVLEPDTESDATPAAGSPAAQPAKSSGDGVRSVLDRVKPGDARPAARQDVKPTHGKRDEPKTDGKRPSPPLGAMPPGLRPAALKRPRPGDEAPDAPDAPAPTDEGPSQHVAPKPPAADAGAPEEASGEKQPPNGTRPGEPVPSAEKQPKSGRGSPHETPPRDREHDETDPKPPTTST